MSPLSRHCPRPPCVPKMNVVSVANFFFLVAIYFCTVTATCFTRRKIFLYSSAYIKSNKGKSLGKKPHSKKNWRERKTVVLFLKEKSNSLPFNKHIPSFLDSFTFPPLPLRASEFTVPGIDGHYCL